ncbi:DNA translocase FtsK [Rummeliibacillus pycnus]|uniref:DNA translocase FtsK n=1 Tax=Rummeliibacillus pycnus TaxID=101070 RepID=UPI0037C859D2
MSWFKKIVSRVLGDEIEETSIKNNDNNNINDEQLYKSFDQYENNYEYEEETPYIENDYQQQPRQQVQSTEPNFIRRRESFNFPMIPDENNRTFQGARPTESSSKQIQNRKVELPDWMQPEELARPVQKQQATQAQYQEPRKPTNQRPEQYSPFTREPRGLRGVVEKTSRENYNPFNPSGIKNSKPQRKEKIPEKIPEKKPEKKPQNLVVEELVKQSYTPQKKKFVPTDVPSPIYGFQKRPKRESNIYDLLDEKENGKEQSSEQKSQEKAALEEVAATTLQLEKIEEPSTNSTSLLNTSPSTSESVPKVEEDTLISGQDYESISEQIKEFEVDKDIQIEENKGQVQNVEVQHIVEETAETHLPSQTSIEESVIEEEPLDTLTPSSLIEQSNVEEKVEIANFISKTIETEKENEIFKENITKTISEEEKIEVQVATIEKKLPLETDFLVDHDNDHSLEGLTEDDATIADIEKETGNEVENAEIEKQEEPITTGSRVPFNVVMLKSDKKKMEQSIPQAIPLPGAKSWGASYAKPVSSASAKVEDRTSNDQDTESDVADQGFIENVISKADSAVTMMEIPSMQRESEEHKESVQIQDALVQQSNIIEEQEPPAINEHLEEALSYLESPEEQTEDFEWMDAQGEKLIEALSYFQIEGEIVQIVQGPAVTQFEITVGHGVKVSKIRNLADDLKLALAAKDIRIQAPIPGKSSIGIEIPNRTSRPVRLSEVVTSESFVDSKSPLEAALGLDLTGEPVTIDLRKMPHGMIAGATGSGKSVCINSLLISLLLKASPQDVKLMLIDPKMVELAPFNHIPHLVSPVITDVKAATAALKWAVEEMDRRYQLFAHVGARDITRYNKMVEKDRKFSLKMPYLVIVIDELADLMMMSPQEVEESICRIAQKARACGIHLVLATQRPSVDVITGLIKSNIPTRIAFSVSSNVDSRTILDSQGAERLLGRGDMLYLGNGMSAPVRVQGTYVTDEEIEAVTNFVRTLGEPDYIFEQEELLKKVDSIEDQDELFEEACRFICSEGSVSASSLQRKYRIGYNRAARLVDMMEAQGFISESKGTKPRDVFLTEPDINEIFGSNHA